MDQQRRRLKIHSILCDEILRSQNAYFQPPESVRLKYPCIVYNRNAGLTWNADDQHYHHQPGYTVTIIDRNPDSTLPDDLMRAIPASRFDRFFVSDNLNHWVFTIY